MSVSVTTVFQGRPFFVFETTRIAEVRNFVQIFGVGVDGKVYFFVYPSVPNLDNAAKKVMKSHRQRLISPENPVNFLKIILSDKTGSTGLVTGEVFKRVWKESAGEGDIEGTKRLSCKLESIFRIS